MSTTNSDAAAAAGGGSSNAAQPYDLAAPLTRPVTLLQVTHFNPGEDQRPSLVLGDGSHYYGSLVRDVPNGLGVMLYQYDSSIPVTSPQLTSSSSSSGGVNLLSLFFGGGSASRSDDSPLAALVVRCRDYHKGDRYGGDWVAGRFHGEGVLLTSSFSYQGMWKDGRMHGKGSIQYTKGYVEQQHHGASREGSGGGVSTLLLRGLSLLSPFELMGSSHAPKEYIGDFDEVYHRHGSGLMTYYNGDIYEGEWQNNCRHGKGKLCTADGNEYTGAWVEDEPHGAGQMAYANGELFKGIFVHGQRSGHGIMRFANGDEYFGSFSQDRIEGQGTMRYRNGDVYEGEWKDQMRHGFGQFTLKKTGATMRGTFVHGLINGEGTVEVPGVSTFTGLFIRGVRKYGTILWLDSPKAKVNDGVKSDATSPAAAAASTEPQSPSTSATDNASDATSAIAAAAAQTAAVPARRLCYQGDWRGEHPHGRGLLWFTNGDFFFGNFVKSVRTGLGNMRYASSGAEYSGSFHCNARHGRGLMQLADGSICAGLWNADVFVEGYEGQWNGSTLHGLGRLSLPLDLFFALVSGNSAAIAACTTATALPSGSSDETVNATAESTIGGDATAASGNAVSLELSSGSPQSSGADSQPFIHRAELPPHYMSFYGLFRDGIRDGPGVLRLPALGGLVGGDVNLVDEKKNVERQQCGSAEQVKAVANTRRGPAGPPDCGQSASHRCMILKGRWSREVLQCDTGIWAFPSGEVYVGGFEGGRRHGDCGRLWLPDGSVYVGAWREDAPNGKGVWYARSRVDPIYRTIVSSQCRLSMPRRNSATPPSSPSRNQPNGISGSGLLGFFFLWDLLGNSSADDGGSSAADGGDTAPQRALVDFHRHYALACSWRHCTMDLSSYATVVLPQVGEQTAPLANGYPWPQVFHSSSMAAALRYHTRIIQAGCSLPSSLNPPPKQSGGSKPQAAQVEPWPVPSAKRITSCATALHLKKGPADFAVGRADGSGVMYFESGVMVASQWLSNMPRLSNPYQPWSAYDTYVCWKEKHGATLLFFDGQLNGDGSDNNSSTSSRGPSCPPPQSSSCFSIPLAAASEEVRGEPRRGPAARSATLSALTTAASPLAVACDSPKHTPSNGEGAAPPTPEQCCTFCSRSYSFFRRRAQCTMCLRSSCAACLTPMEVNTGAEDIQAILKHQYVVLERVQKITSDATASSPSAQAAAAAVALSRVAAVDVDASFSANAVSTVPVCGDCARSLLLQMRYTEMWVPMSIFASVFNDGDLRRSTAVGVKAVADRETVNEASLPLPTRFQDTGSNDDNGDSAAVTAYGRESTRYVDCNDEESLVYDGSQAALHTVDFVDHDVAEPVLIATEEVLCTDETQKSFAVGEDNSTGTVPGKEEVVSSVPSPSPKPADHRSDGGENALAAATAPGTSAPPGEEWRSCSGGVAPSRRGRSSCELLPPAQYIIYSGYTSYSMPHLYGEMWWGRRYYYRGGFFSGRRHGFGVQYMPNGEHYAGYFVDDEWHGDGAYYFDDGSILTGHFERGVLQRAVYRGEMHEEAVDIPSTVGGMKPRRRIKLVPHGRGVGYGADGSVYNGEWRSGQRHGTGMLQFPGGVAVYSGSFVHGRMEGIGKLVCTDGTSYYGSFAADKQHGSGLLFHPGGVLEGRWLSGASDGMVREYSRDTGEVYETTYRDGNERDDCFATSLMVNDDAVLTCGQCGVAFSFFLRRHHCRLCGDVFCDGCSQQRAVLPPNCFALESGAVNAAAAAATATPQRVCGACFHRLEQRRMIGIHRYVDGSVYAGCWSQGRWVSRGLYCRPDGLFVVMDAHGGPCVVKTDATGPQGINPDGPTGRHPSRSSSRHRPAVPSVMSASVLQDASPEKATLDTWVESSPRGDLDAFLLWWATTANRCGLQVRLDIPLLHRYQQMPIALLRRKDSTVLADSDAAAYLAGRASNTPSVPTVDLSLPSIPQQPPIKMFVTLADMYNAVQDADGTKRVEVDADIEAAALRASKFMPVMIPRAPATPMTTAVEPSKTGSGVSTWVLRPPPAIDDFDIADDDYLRMIQQERQLWPESPSDSAVVKETDGSTEAEPEPAAVTPSAAMALVVPLLPPTPPLPTLSHLDVIPWNDWGVREVPYFCPAVSSADAPAATTADSLPAPLNDVERYFSCSFLQPAVPNTQEVLERGKIWHVEKLVEKMQRCSDDGGNGGAAVQGEKGGKAGAAAAPSVVADTAKPKQGGSSRETITGALESSATPETHVKAFGWAPTPLRGPFSFTISTAEPPRDRNEGPVVFKVTQTEATN